MRTVARWIITIPLASAIQNAVRGVVTVRGNETAEQSADIRIDGRAGPFVARRSRSGWKG
jgi:hypothetical protein